MSETTDETNYAEVFSRSGELSLGETALILEPDGNARIVVGGAESGRITGENATSVVLALAALMFLNSEGDHAQGDARDAFVRKAATWFSQFGLRGLRDVLN